MTFIQKQALWVSRDADGNIVLHFPTSHVAYIEGAVATVNGATPDENKNVTITDITGNAETATALKTKRNINGVAFNGTEDINIDVGVKKINGVVADGTGNVSIGDYISNIDITGKTVTVTFKNNTTKSFTTQDTTYSVATTSKEGLMSASDKTKLNNIADKAGGSMVSKSSLTGSLSKSTSSVTKTITDLTALKPIYVYLYTTYQQTTDYWAQFNAITGLKHGNFTGGTTACSTKAEGDQYCFIPSGTSISITLKLNSTSNYSNVDYKIEVYQ